MIPVLLWDGGRDFTIDEGIERNATAGEVANTGIGLAQVVSPKHEIITDRQIRDCDEGHREACVVGSVEQWEVGIRDKRTFGIIFVVRDYSLSHGLRAARGRTRE
jgi:hypothetical protein